MSAGTIIDFEEKLTIFLGLGDRCQSYSTPQLHTETLLHAHDEPGWHEPFIRRVR